MPLLSVVKKLGYLLSMIRASDNLEGKPERYMSQTNPNLTAPVTRRLVSATFHSLIGLLSIALFNVTDLWFISHLGVDALAAMGFVSPIILTMVALLISCELTGSISVSEKLAASDKKQIRKSILAILTFAVGISAILGLIGIFATPLIMMLLGADGFPSMLGESYLKVWFLHFPLLSICMVGNGLLRQDGLARKATRIVIISTLLNAILDPLFIFGYGEFAGHGIQGAAWATLSARVVCALMVLYALNKHYRLTQYRSFSLHGLVDSWRNLVANVLAASFNRVLIPGSVIIATVFIAQFGEATVAVFGVINILQTFPLAFVLALNSVMVPFIRQNLAVDNIARVGQAVKLAIRFVMAWGVAQAIGFSILSGKIANAFAVDMEVVELLAFYFQMVPLSLIGIGLCLTNNAVSYSLMRFSRVMLMNLVRIFVFFLPGVFIGGVIGGSMGILVGLGIANVGVGIVAIFGLRAVLRNQHSENALPQSI